MVTRARWLTRETGTIVLHETGSVELRVFVQLNGHVAKLSSASLTSFFSSHCDSIGPFSPPSWHKSAIENGIIFDVFRFRCYMKLILAVDYDKWKNLRQITNLSFHWEIIDFKLIKNFLYINICKTMFKTSCTQKRK